MMALILFVLIPLPVFALDRVQLFHGYVSKVHCAGRLLVSAVGNDALVRLEALPRELGCGILLKPVASSGASNLILETSAGTVSVLIEIQPGGRTPKATDLEFELKAVAP